MLAKLLPLCTCLGLLAGNSNGTRAGEPFIEKVDLFRADTDGYKLYRIPGIVVTTQGTVLAYCEARKRQGSDWATIDIMLRRSTDSGRTWQPPAKIAHVDGPKSKNPVALRQALATPDEVTYNNPVAIVDRQTGAVHFVFCLEYMRCFYMRSDDDGLTFSKPVEITDTFMKFKSDYDLKVIATGPGHGIQLENGRLLVPVWISTGTGGHAHRPSVTSVIYSDDHGQSWQRGEIAGPDEGEFNIPNESVAVQLAGGDVLLNMRSESTADRRLLTRSKDGATNWTTPRFHPQLLEPICMASMVRLTKRPESDLNRLLFSNPDTLDPRPGQKAEPGKSRVRKNVTVKLSYDESETWPVSKTIEPGFSGYSDLAVTHDGTILCFYERGSTDGQTIYNTGWLTVARFNLEWLTDGQDAL
jgi:sialidase-1